MGHKRVIYYNDLHGGTLLPRATVEL